MGLRSLYDGHSDVLTTSGRLRRDSNLRTSTHSLARYWPSHHACNLLISQLLHVRCHVLLERTIWASPAVTNDVLVKHAWHCTANAHSKAHTVSPASRLLCKWTRRVTSLSGCCNLYAKYAIWISTSLHHNSQICRRHWFLFRQQSWFCKTTPSRPSHFLTTEFFSMI